MRIYLSQSFENMCSKKVKKYRNEVIEILKEKFPGEEFEILENYISKFKGSAFELFLIRMEVMKNADLIVFGKNWYNSDGCKIESQIAQVYKFKIFMLEIPSI